MKKTTFFLPVIIAFLIAAASCESPRSTNYYTFEGYHMASNYSSFGGQHEDSVLATPVIPAMEGDILTGGDFIVLAKGQKNKTLVFSDTATHLRLDGYIFSLNISELSEIFPQLKDEDLGKLSFLVIDQIPTNDQFTILEKISSVNKSISFSISKEIEISEDRSYDLLEKLLTLFNPKIFDGYLTEKSAALLAKENELEALMIPSDDSVLFILPKIPSLKTIVLMNDTIHTDFFRNNTEIENIAILNTDIVDISMLAQFRNLRSIAYPFCDNLDLTPFAKLKKLDRLMLYGDSINNVSALKELESLRWLHLPNETTQEQFDSIISFQTKIGLLEINSGSNIYDLSKISNCRSLKGLILYGDKMTYKKGLGKLTNLKYLALPEETYADSTYRNLVKKHFPNTTIVPNTGICLGSGWILLLIPLVLIFKLYYRNKISAV
jgi:hypothetical protein